MRIAFITPFLPSPPTYGAQRRLDGLMRGLAKRHEISVVSLVNPAEDVSQSVRATKSYCTNVVAVPCDNLALTTARKRLLQARSLMSARSFETSVFRTPALVHALVDLLSVEPFDIVMFESAQMAANCPSSERLPGDPILILDEHNIEYDIVRRTAISTREIDRKLYSELNWRKLRAEERDAWRRFDGCTVTSSRDEALLLRDVPTARTAVVPNGVDVPFFSAYSAQVPDEMSLLFFGTVRYHPNLDGLLFFLREVMPRLKARYPTVKLRIVGPSVVPEIAARAGDDVEVVGLVDDVRPYIARATVVIVPLRIGGGTRFKILEAMAMGKAAVSTVVGAEGIAVRDGEDILLANDAVHFARQIGRLLDDAALRERIGAAARRLAERDYSWDASVARLEDFSVELLARQARAA